MAVRAKTRTSTKTTEVPEIISRSKLCYVLDKGYGEYIATNSTESTIKVRLQGRSIPLWLHIDTVIMPGLELFLYESYQKYE